MEILNRREQIGAKKLPPVIGDDVEKASKSKFGVVKIGDGINVSSGVISIANTGLSLLPVFTGAITGSSNSITFEADLTGKTVLFFIAEVCSTFVVLIFDCLFLVFDRFINDLFLLFYFLWYVKIVDMYP